MSFFRLCLAGVLLCPWAAPPQTSPASPLEEDLSPPQAMNFTLEGKITRHVPGKVTVNTQENMLFQVRYGDRTEIKRSDGSPGTSKDLRVGVRVRVEGELTESGEIIAARIDVLPAPASGRR